MCVELCSQALHAFRTPCVVLHVGVVPRRVWSKTRHLALHIGVVPHVEWSRAKGVVPPIGVVPHGVRYRAMGVVLHKGEVPHTISSLMSSVTSDWHSHGRILHCELGCITMADCGATQQCGPQ